MLLKYHTIQKEDIQRIFYLWKIFNIVKQSLKDDKMLNDPTLIANSVISHQNELDSSRN